MSLYNNKVVIPIPQMRGGPRANTFTVSQPSNCGLGHVTTKNVYQYMLSFACTIHKSQGTTRKRVVLALSSRYTQQTQMSYASLYVGLNRVRSSNDLRIFLHDTGPRPGRLGLAYIYNLRQDIHILDY